MFQLFWNYFGIQFYSKTGAHLEQNDDLVNKFSLGLLVLENYSSQRFSWVQIMLCLNLNSFKESLLLVSYELFIYHSLKTKQYSVKKWS